ncbi:MAG TPA: hypothetical protein VI756_09475, partial [Blastocatellia bacterium]
MSTAQSAATQLPLTTPVLLGMETVAGMPPGHLVIFTLTENDMRIVHKQLHPAAVTIHPGRDWQPNCANLLLHYDLVILSRSDDYNLTLAKRIARDAYAKAATVRIVR